MVVSVLVFVHMLGSWCFDKTNGDVLSFFIMIILLLRDFQWLSRWCHPSPRRAEGGAHSSPVPLSPAGSVWAQVVTGRHQAGQRWQRQPGVCLECQ